MKLTFVLLVATLTMGLQEKIEMPKATFYYIPFQIETYEAVTRDNIKAKAKYTIILTDGEKISRIQKLLHGGKAAQFNNGRVRLLAEIGNDGENMFVDAEGVCLNGTTPRALSDTNFVELKQLMADLSVPRSLPSKP